MNIIESLMQRNEAFATSGFSPVLKMLPSARTMILGCVDPRVDPADIFSLAPGEALIIRNVGGRLDPGTLQTFGILRAVAKSRGAEVGDGWNLIILHHTDCGIIPCHHHAPEKLATYLGVEQDALAMMAIDDPYASVALDIATLKANPKLPPAITVTGLVYDVATGIVKTVVPPARLREEAAG